MHQPDNLPYLGFFYKMWQADALVTFDTAQFVKAHTHNRQRIRTKDGSLWLTIPVSGSFLSFRETKINYDHASRHPWNQRHWRIIENSYGRAPYFKQYAEDLKALYHRENIETLAEWNIAFIEFFNKAFNLNKPLTLFSSLGISENLSASEKIAIATEKMGGTIYLSGPTGKKYLEYKPFEERGIEVRFSDFTHPEYPQYHAQFDKKFEKNMAALDALFNLGCLPFGEGYKENTLTAFSESVHL